MMIHGDAAPGDQQAVDVLREERSVGDLIHEQPRDQFTGFAVLRPAFLAVGRMPTLLARILLIGVDRDNIVIAPSGDDVVLGHDILAPDAAGLTHTNGRGRVKNEALLEPGDILPRERRELQHLVAGLDLGA